MITLRLIIEIVSQHYGLREIELIADRRAQPAAMARQVVWALARRLTPLSLPVLGRRMGRDHSTVLYGADRVEARAVRDVAFAEELLALEAGVRAAAEIMARSRVGSVLEDIDPEPVALRLLTQRRSLATLSNREALALARPVISASLMHRAVDLANELLGDVMAVCAAWDALKGASGDDSHLRRRMADALNHLQATASDFAAARDHNPEPDDAEEAPHVQH